MLSMFGAGTANHASMSDLIQIKGCNLSSIELNILSPVFELHLPLNYERTFVRSNC